MSYIDDHYADLVREETASKEAFESGVKQTPDQQVVDDSIGLFKSKTSLNGDTQKAKDILKTISRLKRVSEKQKRFLYSFLLINHEEYREKHHDLFEKFL